MKKIITLLKVCLLLHLACASQQTFKKDIPLEKDGHIDYFFKYISQDSKDLGLGFIENGYDSLQVRIWLGHSLAVNKNIIILKKNNGKWSGQLITYSYGHDEKNGKEFLNKKYIKEITPKSGWEYLTKKMMEFKILTLPNSNDILGYNDCGNDGIAYFFEIATLQKYRFYYYCNPGDNQSKFWEAKYVLEFSNLLENEFNFSYTK